MNTIILLVYMSGFVDKIEWVLLFSFWVTLGIILLVMLFAIMPDIDYSSYLDDYDNKPKQQTAEEFNKEVLQKIKNVFKSLKSVIIICFMSIFLYIIIPSQKTIYLISGTYVGNEVVQSETGKKVIKVIDLKLDEYINNQIKEGKTDKNAK